MITYQGSQTAVNARNAREAETTLTAVERLVGKQALLLPTTLYLRYLPYLLARVVPLTAHSSLLTHTSLLTTCYPLLTLPTPQTMHIIPRTPPLPHSLWPVSSLQAISIFASTHNTVIRDALRESERISALLQNATLTQDWPAAINRASAGIGGKFVGQLQQVVGCVRWAVGGWLCVVGVVWCE